MFFLKKNSLHQNMYSDIYFLKDKKNYTRDNE